tara:strand:+ start:359 stop:622 length:264 start_codon:yes stop_codon:yes gene_type:complete
MPKQKLSPAAKKKKAARDLAYAKGIAWQGKSTAKFKRKEKKAENQRIGQNSTSDIHHVNGKVGNTKRVSVASNRDTWKNGDRKKKKK